MSKARCVVTAVISVFAAFAVYQLSWAYYIQQEMWTWGFMDAQFQPIAYGLAALTLTIGAGVSWKLRPKTQPKPTDTLPKEERTKLTGYWKLLQKMGTPAQKKDFIKTHPEFFGFINTAEKTEINEGDLSLHFSSPFPPPSSSPKPELTELPDPAQTLESSDDIIIKIPKEQLRKLQSHRGNNGFEDNFNKQMETIFLKALEEGRLNTNVTIKRENGKFKIPENLNFSIIKKEPEKPLEPAKKEDPKLKRHRP